MVRSGKLSTHEGVTTKRRWSVLFALVLAVACTAGASEFEMKIRKSFDAGDPAPTEIFKIRDKVEVHYFAPAKPRLSGNNPALVYIHGGGWKGGNPIGTYRWCRYLAELGVSAFTVRYQLANEKLGIKPDQCLKDAKTAMRWVRANADKLGINPDRIAANGNSAGGHLSAALATIDGFNDSADDLSVSCHPNLLLLTSPVLDNGPGGYGNGHYSNQKKTNDYRVAEFSEIFSPLHNLNNELPDTLVLMGDEDPFIGMEAVGKFGQGVRAAGSEFEWWVFPDKGHGLTSQKKSYLSPELMHIYYAYHSFLARQGYMDPPLPAGDEVRTLTRKQTLGMVDAGRPNFVVILADDMGIGDIGAFRELYPGEPEDQRGCYREPKYPGALPVQLAHKFTPNLDRLAKEGVRCTRAYSAAWCAPSRQMLLSGQWSSRANAYDHPWIGSQMRAAGYATGFVGKSHGKKPTQKVYGNTNPQAAEFEDGLFFNNGARGFYMKAGERLPGRIGLEPFSFTAKENDYITDVFTDHAVGFIERHAAEPFMLYLPYTAPHEPLHGKPEDLKKLFPEVFADRSDASIIAEVNGSKYRGISDNMKAYHYAAMVYNMDLGIGRIMQTLKEQGLDQNTLIIFTCDNGAQWGCNYPGSGHKSETRDGGIRVPFVVWSTELAASDRSGSVYNGLISLADIAPTLLGQATEQPYQHPSDGIDVMPFITGQKAPPTGRTYFWSNACSGNTLKTKLDGAHEFSDEPLAKAIMQTVFVKDDWKITCWNSLGRDAVGAVYNHLPDVAGKQNSASLVIENPPVAGQLPVEGAGRALFDEMLQAIRDAEGGLAPTWTGTPDTGKYSWEIAQ